MANDQRFQSWLNSYGYTDYFLTEELNQELIN